MNKPKEQRKQVKIGEESLAAVFGQKGKASPPPCGHPLSICMERGPRNPAVVEI